MTTASAHPCANHTGPSPRTLAVLSLLLGPACASSAVYVPAGVHLPLLDRAEEFHVSGQYGRPGFQINGAYAVTDRIAVRATGQGNARGDGFLRMASGGVAYFFASPVGEPKDRLSVAGSIGLGVGVAAVRGGVIVQKERTQPKIFYGGTLLRSAVEGELGLRGRFIESGVVVRASYLHLDHDESSFARGTSADHGYLEPGLVLRAGFEDLKLEAQVLTSLPLFRSGEIGSVEQVVGSLGLAADFD